LNDSISLGHILNNVRIVEFYQDVFIVKTCHRPDL